MISKIYIIAGEPSGDFIGSTLIKSIKLIQSEHHINVEFSGLGGPLMQSQGLMSLFNIDQLSLMGFIEILPKFFKLKKLIKQTVEHIIQVDPAILITVDSPGFTLLVAKKVRKLRKSLQIIHIVAPSVWAYKPERAKKYAQVYNHLLTLLPFEPPYFTKVGLPSTYVGHFISEQIYFTDKKQLRYQNNIFEKTKILCVTPGSRKGEILRHMPIFSKALQIIQSTYPNLKVIFVLNNGKYQDLIEEFLEGTNLDYSFSNDRLKIFALADIALAKSGTNTLELAASATPMVVAYTLNYLSFAILKFLIKVTYASLINIIAKREIIPEFIQSNCTPEKISTAIIDLLDDSDKRLSQVNACQAVLESIGFDSPTKPSVKAAKLIIENLK